MTERFLSLGSRPDPSLLPLRNLERYNARTLIIEVDRLLNDPAAVLTMPASDYFDFLGPRNVEDYISQRFEKDRPKRRDAIIAIAQKALSKEGSAGILIEGARHATGNYLHRKQLKAIYALLPHFSVSRALVGLSDDTKIVVRAVAHAAAHDRYTPSQWRAFLLQTVWEGGAGTISGNPAIRNTEHSGTAYDILKDALDNLMPPYGDFLQQAAADTAHTVSVQASPANGARWMSPQDLAQSTFYTTKQLPEALIIGFEPTKGLPVMFAGHESLISVGGPGSGKSQSQVIPNLFRYRGSAIVLDVMNELWPATAGYRAKHFGPVYRFAPTDPTGQTHRYNPFDFISRDPAQAANDTGVFSYQVIAENPKLTDPYWEQKGRDLMWAFAMMVAIKALPASRSMTGLAEAMSLPLDKDPKSNMSIAIEAMDRLGTKSGIIDLCAAAGAIKTGIKQGSQRLESVMDTSRRYLSPFARSPSLTRAMSRSDWHPEVLRTRPGSTLYICLSVDELKTYGAIVRLILKQHANILLAKRAKPDDLPVTFFLDEMPRLGNFESLLELQAVGRGAGVRLWMFAQTIGQLANAFGQDQYQGVIDACRVRCFLQPEHNAAKLLADALGNVKRMFQSKDQPLAEPHDLMGRAYRDKIIVTTRGDYPMALDKKFAWQTDKDKFLSPPAIR